MWPNIFLAKRFQLITNFQLKKWPHNFENYSAASIFQKGGCHA
jgi:hypothetical protein